MSLNVVVYHSGYGHTQRIAQAVADGASAELMPSMPMAMCPKRVGLL